MITGYLVNIVKAGTVSCY